MLTELILIFVYLGVLMFLGWLGFRRTRSDADYLLAGRKTHPFVMAMSYGAAFISTSAIVGFGGVAAMFGMSLLWLTFLNIFVGIFIAFVFLGPRTRRMGHHLDAHTFPELIGRRYQSRFIQIAGGLIIFLFIPLYSAAVLIGGCNFLAEHFKMSFELALAIFGVIIAVYVITGGLKGAMYAEALQGTIMTGGMIILIGYTYWMLGGPGTAHTKLAAMEPIVPGPFKAMGHNGWTAMPTAGWGAKGYDLWWIVVSTIMLGVGIGVLAQPQLAVRFMTVKSRRELNRAVIFGGIFILLMVGGIYTVGSLSNRWFADYGQPVVGVPVKPLDARSNFAAVHPASRDETGTWTVDSDRTVAIMVDHTLTIDGANGQELLAGRSHSLHYAGGEADRIIPTFITQAMPRWFGVLFLLTLLAAAMSTLSGQFHALGTAIGRDVYEQVTGRHGRSIRVTRVGILVGIVMAVVISQYARGGYFIARATAIFFGLCAATFLPAYVGGLLWRGATRSGAIASMVTGFCVAGFWLVFIKAKEASAIGICEALTGRSSLLIDRPNWYVVDPIVVALPVAAIVFVIVSLLTKRPDETHLRRCFSPSGR